jgi:hypothetical protein
MFRRDVAERQAFDLCSEISTAAEHPGRGRG